VAELESGLNFSIIAVTVVFKGLRV